MRDVELTGVKVRGVPSGVEFTERHAADGMENIPVRWQFDTMTSIL